MNIYLAHPISGLSYNEVMDYYEGMKNRLRRLGYEVLQPMTGKGYLRNELEFKSHGYTGLPASTNHAILERDNWMVRLADVVLVDLWGADKVSIGCMMELAWAHDHHKHTVVVMGLNNVHRHAFVLEAADTIFETRWDAMVYLELLANQEAG